MTKALEFSRLPKGFVVLVLIIMLPELVLQGADLGLWGSARWRPFSYENFAFWPGLLLGWQPNYAAQPWVMFVSYAFLHVGLWHMVTNVLTIVLIGPAEIARIGLRRFLGLYLTSALGGAVGFALLTSSPHPMVGASGAIFGLVGAWFAFDIRRVLRERPGLVTLGWAILWPLVMLVLLNALMYWTADGHLAWETHLGGFVVGAALAPFLAR